MTDLLDQETVDEIRSALRDVTDTFHRTPVALRRPNGVEINLVAGAVPVATGGAGAVNGAVSAREDQTENVERWVVSFNRDYLQEMGLVDTVTGRPLIDPEEDRIVLGGRRFSIIELTDRALFRGVPILVRLVVAR